MRNAFHNILEIFVTCFILLFALLILINNL